MLRVSYTTIISLNCLNQLATLLEMKNEEADSELLEIIHNTLRVPAENYPVNTTNPSTMEEITKEDRLITSSRHQFNIFALASYFDQSKKFTNPFDGLEFSQLDQAHIRSTFDERQIGLPTFDSSIEAGLVRQQVSGWMSQFANSPEASLLRATDLSLLESREALSTTVTFCHNQDSFSGKFRNYSDLVNFFDDLSNPEIIKLVFQTALSHMHFSHIFSDANDIYNCKSSLESRKIASVLWKKMSESVVDELIEMLGEKVLSPSELPRLEYDGYQIGQLQAAFPDRGDEIASQRSTSHNFGRK